MTAWGMVDMIAEEKAVHIAPIDRNGLILSPHVAGMDCGCKPVVILCTAKAQIIAHNEKILDKTYCHVLLNTKYTDT